MSNDFAGLNGFVWWIGVVEDRQDPSKLGRARVRIIGWHDFDENIVPNDSLPWAQIIQPTTGSRTFSSMREGEWVTGYFLDGNNGQQPVIMGVYPGVMSEESINAIAKNAQAPKMPEGLKADVVGEPTLPPMAREKIEDTAIDESNNSQSHVCDITSELKKDVAIVRLAFSNLMDAIRKAIRAFIASLGLDPSGEVSKIVSLAKFFLRELKYYQGILEEILDFKEVLLDYARRVKAMIDYILSLPQKLLQLLADCLANFTGAIVSAIKDLISVPGLDGMGNSSDITELFDVAEQIVETSKQTVSSATELLNVPAQVVSVLTSPASKKEADEAGVILSAYISETVPSAKDVSEANPTYSNELLSQP
jgi:hypothetical protein